MPDMGHLDAASAPAALILPGLVPEAPTDSDEVVGREAHPCKFIDDALLNAGWVCNAEITNCLVCSVAVGVERPDAILR